MDNPTYLEVTAGWNPKAPDIEPPDFRREVWPLFESPDSEITWVIIRHDTKAEKRYWRAFEKELDLEADWSALDWTDKLPGELHKRIYENTAGHLSVFFRQTVTGARRVLEFWRHWPLETSDRLTTVLPNEHEQAVLRRIVTAEARGELLLSLGSERQTAIWFGEALLLSQLKAIDAMPSR